MGDGRFMRVLGDFDEAKVVKLLRVMGWTKQARSVEVELGNEPSAEPTAKKKTAKKATAKKATAKKATAKKATAKKATAKKPTAKKATAKKTARRGARTT